MASVKDSKDICQHCEKNDSMFFRGGDGQWWIGKSGTNPHGFTFCLCYDCVENGVGLPAPGSERNSDVTV